MTITIRIPFAYTIRPTEALKNRLDKTRNENICILAVSCQMLAISQRYVKLKQIVPVCRVETEVCDYFQSIKSPSHRRLSG